LPAARAAKPDETISAFTRAFSAAVAVGVAKVIAISALTVLVAVATASI
jgi:hypothetical protein